MYMPNTDIRFRNAILPGFIAGTAFQFLQYFYIHSQIWVSSYNAIYGSFAALPMFMLWVNFSWIICLFGAQLSYANQNLRSYYYIKDIHKISRSYHDVLLILIMSKVCKRFEKGMEGYTVKGLSVETNLPSGVVGRLTHELNRMHLLVFDRTNEDAAVRFAPAEDINHLTVNLLLERIDNYGDKFTPAAIHRNNTEWETIRELRARYINKGETHPAQRYLSENGRHTALRPIQNKSRPSYSSSRFVMRLRYLPMISNSRLTTEPGFKEWKLVCSYV